MKEKINLFKVFMAPTAAEQVSLVLNSGYIGQGPKVEEFELKLRDYFQHDHLVTVNSGTSALHLALHLLKAPDPLSSWPGLLSGDEVLTTSMTCTASNWPILANGLKIKWVDIDEKTLNYDLDDLSRKISPKTKVIMAVHWGGYPIDLERLKTIQKQAEALYGFKPAIIEDAAHGFGSSFAGKPIGTHGNITMYSLQAIKHITAVDGGILMLPNKQLTRRAKLMRWYGIDRDGDRKDFRCEADIEEWGFKFHMNDISATVGLENLKHAASIIGRHKENARFYDTALAGIPDVTLLARHPSHDSAFWIYSMLVQRRDDFYRKMHERNIAVSQVHERNDKHNCVREFRAPLPTLDRICKNIVSIPVGWWVTDEQREYIVSAIKQGW